MKIILKRSMRPRLLRALTAVLLRPVPGETTNHNSEDNLNSTASLSAWPTTWTSLSVFNP